MKNNESRRACIFKISSSSNDATAQLQRIGQMTFDIAIISKLRPMTIATAPANGEPRSVEVTSCRTPCCRDAVGRAVPCCGGDMMRLPSWLALGLARPQLSMAHAKEFLIVKNHWSLVFGISRKQVA